MIRRIARDFTNLKGVIDDGWYTSKNGTDVQVYRLVSIANAFNGNIDIPGGMIVTARCRSEDSECLPRKRSEWGNLEDG